MDISELIDAAAQAAVEHVELPPEVAELLAGRRPDGTYKLTAFAFGIYFPEEERAENASKTTAGLADSGWLTPLQMRESAFRQLNYALLTDSGVSPVDARATINAAIERGDI